MAALPFTNYSYFKLPTSYTSSKLNVCQLKLDASAESTYTHAHSYYVTIVLYNENLIFQLIDVHVFLA